jgi:hypothetical protein
MRWLKRIVLILLAAILLLIVWVGIVIYIKSAHSRQLTDSWVFKENQVGPVIGDLGGIPVSIPPHVARFVEYEGDPHFLEPRKDDTPARNSQSKLRSFGFEVRFPDKVLLTPETQQEKRKSNIDNSMWLDVGVNVEPYNNELGLRRQVDAIPAEKWDDRHSKDDPPALWKNKHGYKRLRNLLYGLVVDEVYGYDEASRYKFPGVDVADENIYHHVGAQGHVDAFIKCHNVKHHAAPCEHDFVLKSVKNTMVSVLYRRDLLPQWHEIQDAVTQVILDFAIDPQKNDLKTTTTPSVQPGD